MALICKWLNREAMVMLVRVLVWSFFVRFITANALELRRSENRWSSDKLYCDGTVQWRIGNAAHDIGKNRQSGVMVTLSSTLYWRNNEYWSKRIGSVTPSGGNNLCRDVEVWSFNVNCWRLLYRLCASESRSSEAAFRKSSLCDIRLRLSALNYGEAMA